MKEMLVINLDARHALMSASTTILPQENVQVYVKTVIMNLLSTLAQLVLLHAIPVMVLQQLALIALKIA
jgi:hypothetical protein